MPKGVYKRTALHIAAIRAGFEKAKKTRKGWTDTQKQAIRENNIGINLGPLSSRWKGGTSMICGYIQIKYYGKKYASMCTKQLYILEHRLVYAEHLNRPLLDTEIVHHKNHNRSDNRLENLQIMNRSEHAILHLLLRNAKNKDNKNNKDSKECSN